MKLLMYGLTTALSVLAVHAAAGQTLKVDGQDVELSALMAECQEIKNDPAAQIACFNVISQRMDDQVNAEAEPALSVPEALEAFRTVAQYNDGETGLNIAANECVIQITYYANYFHLSRRNISALDMFFAQFDVSKVQFDQTREIRGAQAPLVSAVLDDGANALMSGGLAIESAQFGFAPRGPSTPLNTYASEIAFQIPAQQGSAFEFVLVHPQNSDAGTEIWDAFERYVEACRQ